jgi:hypothetical protein
MMDEEHAKIINTTMSAYCRDAASYHDITIRVFPMPPAGMLFPNNHILVLPRRETGLVTEECLAL